MKTVKLITTQITAKEYQSLIDPDAVKQYYAKMIVGKCTNEMYVTAVRRIVDRSLWRKLCDTKFPGAQASIHAEIEGLTIPEGYVVPSCRVVEVSATSVVFENKYVYGTCPKTPDIAFIKKGMIIPMRATGAIYGTSEKIVITAKLFRHDWQWPVVSVMPAVGSPPKEILDQLTDYIGKSKSKDKGYQTMLNLMRPIAGESSRQNTKQLSGDLPAVGSNIILTEALDGTYYETTDKNYTIRLPADEAVVYLARLYLSYVECYLHMIEDYSEDTIIQAHYGMFRYIGLSQKK